MIDDDKRKPRQHVIVGRMPTTARFDVGLRDRVRFEGRWKRPTGTVAADINREEHDNVD
jgi:hypothetical protein